MASEAIIFIPSLSKMEKGKALDNLINGLINCQDIATKVSKPEEVALGGHKGKQIVVNFKSEVKTIDFFEVYWNDLTYSLADSNVLKKLIKATGIIIYWFFQKYGGELLDQQ